LNHYYNVDADADADADAVIVVVDMKEWHYRMGM
jgi:hypothetical protein